jgi:hypothetical protein
MWRNAVSIRQFGAKDVRLALFDGSPASSANRAPGGTLSEAGPHTISFGVTSTCAWSCDRDALLSKLSAPIRIRGGPFLSLQLPPAELVDVHLNRPAEAHFSPGKAEGAQFSTIE